MPNGLGKDENEDDNSKTTGRKQDAPDWKKDVEDLENLLESNQWRTDVDELEKLLSEGLSLDSIEAVKDKALDDITDRMENELPEMREDQIDPWVEAYQKRYDVITRLAIEQLGESKTDLEEKREQLIKEPTLKDKIKAFFKHGAKGIDGEIEKINQKLKVTELALKDQQQCLTPEQRQERVQILKDELLQNKMQLRERAGHVVALRLEESVPIHDLTDEQRKKSEIAVGETEELQSVRKSLKAQLKVEKKAMQLGDESDEVRKREGNIPRKMPK